MSKHKHRNHGNNNTLTNLEKTLMTDINVLLAAIATIAKGNQTDPAVTAQIATLNTEMTATQITDANQETLIEALIHQLAASTPPALPVVASTSIPGGSVNGGETVTLTGTGFTGATAVNFGTVAGTSLSVTSDTSLTIVAPAQAAATVNVTVITPAGTSLVGTANAYVYA
jgi:transcription elongation GreA/GreB family factor